MERSAVTRRGDSCVFIVMVAVLVSWTSAVSHSHHYFTTVTNHRGPGHPSYFTTREIDGVVLYWYDSRTQLLEIRAPWVKNTNISLRSINIIEGRYQRMMQNYLQAIMNYTNASEGYHILQKIEGCTLHDNGSVEAILTEAYNGQRFTHFNPDTANWTTDIAAAQLYVDMLNSNRTQNELIKDQLEEICQADLELLLPAGNATLSRREEPVLEVTQGPMSNTTTILHCRAYGHYPREISMSWYKNGQRIPDEELERMTLPLPDTDFMSSLSANVSLTPGHLYSCHVAHSSLNTPLTREWKVPDLSPEASLGRGLSVGMVIAFTLLAVLLTLMAVFALLTWEKFRRERTLGEILVNS